MVKQVIENSATGPAGNVVEVDRLTKKFDKVTAVDGISFEVKEGECFGLLGPNEAGKTTTLMLLATVFNPTSGTARVGGHNILKQKEAVRSNIGMVFEELSLDIQLTGRDNLYFHACMYHMPKKARKDRIEEVLKVVDLEDKADIPVKNYSGGMQRRLEIARSMLTQPRVLLLDEPTVGLDVQTRRFMWDYVKELNRNRGMTVLLATHYIEEARYLCDRIGIMNEGRIATIGTPKELTESVGKSGVFMSLSDNGLEGFPRALKSLPWVGNVEQKDGLLEIGLESGRVDLTQIAELAHARGLGITSLSVRKPSLEDVFFHYVGVPLEAEQE